MPVKKWPSLCPCLCLLLWLAAPAVLWPQERPNTAVRNFSPGELRADLSFYRQKLEQLHPNLYLYTTKNRLEHLFDSLEKTVDLPMSELDFYKHICILSNYIRDGHSLILPSQATIAWHNAHGRFWPLSIEPHAKVWKVKDNARLGQALPAGSSILSINGIPMVEIWSSLVERQVRDGLNTAYAEWVIKQYFRDYYAFHYGYPESFRVTYLHQGVTGTVSLPALLKDSLTAREQVVAGGDRPAAIVWSYDPDRGQAHLTIKTFHRRPLKQVYNQKFRKSIRQGFKVMQEQNTRHLTIDLRDNQGGDIIYGVYLLRQLLDRPFKMVQGYYGLKDGEIVSVHGPCTGWHRPKKQAFQGSVDIWLNGGSFSNSILVSSCLAQYEQVTFRGSESGGNPHVLAGQTKTFTLPHTRIRVDIPTKRFVLTSLEQNDGRGILPSSDHPGTRSKDVVRMKSFN